MIAWDLISAEVDRGGEVVVRVESTDGWDCEEIVLTRKEAKRLKRALKGALKNG